MAYVLALVLAPLVSGLLCLWLTRSAHLPRVALSGAVATFLAALAYAWRVVDGGSFVTLGGWLHGDGLAALVVLVCGVATLAVTVYGPPTVLFAVKFATATPSRPVWETMVVAPFAKVPLGPLAGGMIFDRFGSYGWLYVGSFGIGWGAVLIALTFRPARPSGPSWPVVSTGIGRRTGPRARRPEHRPRHRPETGSRPCRPRRGHRLRSAALAPSARRTGRTCGASQHRRERRMPRSSL